MNICIAFSFLVFIVLCDSSSPKPYDERCKSILNASSSKCPHQRWFFNWKNKVCLPSCSGTAPFSSKIECQGACRSGDACDFPVASAHCFGEVFPVYVYSHKHESCFLTYDCTYFLNKFPALGECQRTCIQPQQHVKSPGVSSTQGSGQPSYFNILPGQQGHTASKIPILRIKMMPTPPTMDNQCRIRVANALLSECLHKRWYYNESKRVCEPTCSDEAPFLNKIACDGVYRTVDVCNFPMASFPCFGDAHSIFIYNPNDKSCFKSYSCSYFGNKFPTLDECRRTCKKCAAEDQSGCPATISSQGNDQLSTLASRAGDQIPPLHSGLSTGAALANDRCRITLNTTISKCSLQRWYLHKETKQCLQSCDPAAPFSNKIQCEGTCRNGEVCDYPMAGANCFGEVFPVYIFNPNKKRCFLTYDCSYFGNKFPTLGECQRTCEKRKGSVPYPGQTDNTISQGSSQLKDTAGSASGTTQTATGTGSPLNQSLTDNSIRQVSPQPTTSGTSGLPAQQTAMGTGSLMLPGQPGNAIQQVTSQSPSASVGSGLAAHATATAAGDQQFGGSTATRTHIGGSATNSNQAVGVGQATTSPSQSTLVTGITGAPTAHARGSTIPAMSSTQVSGPTSNVNASPTDQVLLPQSRNPTILQQMQQIPTEQQDVTYTAGSSQQACTPPCNFNMSFLQQGALQLNLTAVKIEARPKRPASDRRCKVIATLPTYKCGQKWFFNKRTRTCLPSCSRRAPFRSKIACDGVCRSVEVCDFPMASIACFREVHEVFIYNANQNSCFKAYDCSYFGNKFPTLQQCQKTCRKGASQQHLAGSGAGTSLASMPIQNAGSTVGLQPALSHSGTSLGPGLFGTQTGMGRAQLQVGNGAASISQVSGETSNSDTTASHQAGQSLSGMSAGSDLEGHQPGTAQVSTTSLQGSGQSSGSGSLLIQQHGQAGPVLTAQQAALGAADQQVSAVLGSSTNTSGHISLSVPHANNQPPQSSLGQSTATSPSGHRQGAAQLSTSSLLASTQGSGNTRTQSIHQHGQTAPDLLTRQAALGAALQQIATVTAGSAQASGSELHSGSSAGDLPAPSLSATSTGTGLVGQHLETAQVSTSSSSSSAQVAGSRGGVLAQQLAQTGKGVVAGQPAVELTNPVLALAQTRAVHPAIQKQMVPAMFGYAISSEDKRTLDVKLIKK